MKKLSQLTLAFILLFSSFSLSFAQTNQDFELPGDIEIVDLEDDRTAAPEQEEKPTEEEEDIIIKEEFVPPERSFLTILQAILIPSFFVILVYFILKFFKF